VRSIVAILIFLAVGLSGCFDPTVSVTVHQMGDKEIFEITTHHINGLMQFTLWRSDTKDLIWDVNLRSYLGPELVYGDIPVNFKTFKGGSYSAEQEYPASNMRPARLPSNCRLYLIVGMQYDTFMAASATISKFALTTDENGHVTSIIPAHFTSDDYPKKQ
jgi:hypothetical protein